MKKSTADTLLGLTGSILLMSAKKGSPARAFMDSDRFHDRFQQMNNGIKFSEKVEELREVFVRHLFSFDWMRKSQIYAGSNFPITDAVLKVNNLIGNPETLQLEYRFISNPNRKSFRSNWDLILRNPMYRHIMTKRLIMPAAFVGKIVSTGKKVSLGVGFYSLNNQAWKLIKQEYETNPAFKKEFDEGLDEMLRHELYHVIDPRNYKSKEHKVNVKALSSLDTGEGYHDALNQRATWTNELYDRFWNLLEFYIDQGMAGHKNEMVVDIIIDPVGFWSEDRGSLLGTDDMEYGPMLANTTQAIYTSFKDQGIDISDIRKRYGNNYQPALTFQQRWKKTFGGNG